jgi:hypothetical protein
MSAGDPSFPGEVSILAHRATQLWHYFSQKQLSSALQSENRYYILEQQIDTFFQFIKNNQIPALSSLIQEYQRQGISHRSLNYRFINHVSHTHPQLGTLTPVQYALAQGSWDIAFLLITRFKLPAQGLFRALDLQKMFSEKQKDSVGKLVMLLQQSAPLEIDQFFILCVRHEEQKQLENFLLLGFKPTQKKYEHPNSIIIQRYLQAQFYYTPFPILPMYEEPSLGDLANKDFALLDFIFTNNMAPLDEPLLGHYIMQCLWQTFIQLTKWDDALVSFDTSLGIIYLLLCFYLIEIRFLYVYRHDFFDKLLDFYQKLRETYAISPSWSKIFNREYLRIKVPLGCQKKELRLCSIAAEGKEKLKEIYHLALQYIAIIEKRITTLIPPTNNSHGFYQDYLHLYKDFIHPLLRTLLYCDLYHKQEQQWMKYVIEKTNLDCALQIAEHVYEMNIMTSLAHYY